MDGLQLISKIRETDKRTKIIILTCYDEFDLVHKALRLGVTDYILKLKMTPEELKNAVCKARDELRGEDTRPEAGCAAFIDSGEVKERLFKDFILYKNCTESEFRLAAEKLNLRLTPSRLVFCLMRLDRTPEAKKRLEVVRERTLRQAIRNFTEELLAKYGRGEMIPAEEDHYWLTLSFGDISSMKATGELRDEILGRVEVLMKTYVNSNVTFGVSGFRDGWKSLPELYAQAQSALDEAYYVRDGAIVRFGGNNRDSYLGQLRELRQTADERGGLPVFPRSSEGVRQLSASDRAAADDFIHTNVSVRYKSGAAVRAGEEAELELTLTNRLPDQRHADIEYFLPEGFTLVDGKKHISLMNETLKTSAQLTFSVKVRAGETVQPQNRGILRMTFPGRPTVALIPLLWLGE